jgi:hypothetical protein
VSRLCSIVDSVDCEAPIDGLVLSQVSSCWACGDDVCRGCSSVVSYRWKGQRRRMRFCYRCQDERHVGRGEKRSASWS